MLKNIAVDPGGCWRWTGHVHTTGYGRTSIGKRLLYTHRVAYELWHSAIPTGLQIDHLCRNRLCCNPAHLEPVTNIINARRGERATKTRCVHGHEYTATGVYYGHGRRRCRACQLARQKRRYAERG